MSRLPRLRQTRRRVAAITIRAVMCQLAGQIQPDFAADRAPAAAKSVILAQINAGFGIDHAIEQGVKIIARLRGAREGVQRPYLVSG